VVAFPAYGTFFVGALMVGVDRSRSFGRMVQIRQSF
jgi:hypothetical protein